MKNKIVAFMLSLMISLPCFAASPSDVLKSTVDKIIKIAVDTKQNDEIKKAELLDIINSSVDFESLSKSVVSKHWDAATDSQKQAFKEEFGKVMLKKYFSLIQGYSNEEIIIIKEVIKEDRLAQIDTEIISKDVKTLVRYRMKKINDTWKVYDFIPEGVSFATSYRKNYAIILNQSGLDALIAELTSKNNNSNK